MPLIRERSAALLCAFALLASVAQARAQSEDDGADAHTGVSSALLFGYGYEFLQGFQGLGLGIGASGGYTFSRPRLYLGGSVLVHFGSAEAARASSYRYRNQRYEYAFSADAGYEFSLGPYSLLRLMLAGGVFVDNASTTIGQDSISSHDVYGFLGPAASVLFDLGRVRTGLDLRIPIFPSAFVSRLMALAYVSVGMRL